MLKVIKFFFTTLMINLYQQIRVTDENRQEVLNRIAFGSCSNLWNYTSDIFSSINKYNPNIWIWLGDASYVDNMALPHYWKPQTNYSIIENIFSKQKNNPDYKKLVNKSKIIGIWDDHDYNMNNGDYSNPTKEEIRKIYLKFIDEDQSSFRYIQKGGIYVSYVFGYGRKQVKIILLDVRFSKTKNNILGEEQWQFLEREIQSISADIRFTLIGSGIQIIQGDKPIAECWDFESKKRLYQLIGKYNKPGIIFLSGDIHLGEILSTKKSVGSMTYPAYEITSSGLTHHVDLFFKGLGKYLIDAFINDQYLVNNRFINLNFGTIEFDWTNIEDPQIILQIRNETGNVQNEIKLNLSQLTGDKNSPPLIKHSYFNVYKYLLAKKIQQFPSQLTIIFTFLICSINAVIGIMICLKLKYLIFQKKIKKNQEINDLIYDKKNS